jgi:hypothetical protein
MGVRFWRLSALSGLALILAGALPPLARAHGPINPAASNYLARVRTTPPGIQVRVVDGDLRLWMHVAPGRQVTVLDYQGAPYMRFTAAGVETNANSAMYYLNQTPPETPPTNVNAHARPHWLKVSSAHSFEWHDGRLHALAATLSSPGTRDLGAWTIPLRINGQRATITGVLDRAPAPSAGWWWPIAVVLFGLPAILRLGDRTLDRRLARGLSWIGLAGFVVASVASGLHGRPGLAGSKLATLAVELLFAAWAAWSLRRRRHEILLLCLIAFAVLFRGAAAITVLWRGYVLLALPAVLSRIAVVVCLATGIGLLALIWVLGSRDARAGLPAATTEEQQPPAERASAEGAPTQRSPVA